MRRETLSFFFPTWSQLTALLDEGSGSEVDKVGVLGSSCGLEQSSSASDVISVKTKTQYKALDSNLLP